MQSQPSSDLSITSQDRNALATSGALAIIDRLLKKHGMNTKAALQDLVALILDDEGLISETAFIALELRATTLRQSSTIVRSHTRTTSMAQNRGVTPPSPARVVATLRSAATLAKADLLSTYRLRDGRLLGNVRFGELRTLASETKAEADLVQRVYSYLGPSADPLKSVKELMKSSAFELIATEVGAI